MAKIDKKNNFPKNGIWGSLSLSVSLDAKEITVIATSNNDSILKREILRKNPKPVMQCK